MYIDTHGISVPTGHTRNSACQKQKEKCSNKKDADDGEGSGSSLVS